MKAFALVLFLAASAQADQIQYIHQGFGGSGTLNGVAFSDVNFTFTAEADTANVQAYSSGFILIHASSKVNIAGIGDVIFTSPTETYVNHNSGQVGFSRGDDGNDLFNGPQNAALTTWDLISPIGPIAGVGTLLQWSLSPVTTDHGVLVFDNKIGQGVFGAKIVPAPGAAALGFTVLGLTARRRRA